ncbi:Ger(x)C family spore germination protein [Paenibacillus sp. HB172176]|uniref:Ger(x)C family spore germination protein n=1 Tax=Paenibacillus sp. HB172176 TaxID=2493690 RepID=UPI00143C3C24|nr:Ger(x)C family spore germination protein [Paenibacillus sp. HB172176]
MTASIKGLIVTGLLLFICGCWDMKDIRDTNYVTGVGIDFLDNQYEAYAQMIDFTYLARSEGMMNGNHDPSYNGHGKNPVLDLAINELYRTMQMNTKWAMINSVVLTDRVLKEKGTLFFWDLFTRYREIRMTPWIFGTTERLDELFATEGFFNSSPLTEIMYEPVANYNQHSEIKPYMLFQYGAELNEPGSIVVLPSLGIQKTTWTSGERKKPSPKMFVNGAFLLNDKRMKGWMPLKDLIGLRWTQQKTERTPLLVRKPGSEEYTIISIKNIDVHKHAAKKGSRPRYSIDIDLAGVILEVHGDFSIADIQKLAEARVEQEVRLTYGKGLALQTDIYSLRHEFYKKYPREWLKGAPGDFAISSDSLETVHVTFELKELGLNKLTAK